MCKILQVRDLQTVRFGSETLTSRSRFILGSIKYCLPAGGYEYLKERMAEVTDADRLRLWQPPITGDIIMQTFGIPPSKEVGIVKTAVREAMLEGPIPNDYDAGFQRMLEEGAKLGLKVKSVS